MIIVFYIITIVLGILIIKLGNVLFWYIKEKRIMDELNVVGRAFGSTTTAEKQDNGDWKVTVSMIEKRQLDGAEWEEKELKSVCTDTNFEKAYSVALNSVLEKFKDLLDETKSDSMFAEEVLPIAPESKTTLIS